MIYRSRAKRYERMMKAHCIGPEPPYNTKETPELSPRKEPKKETSSAKTKKRKSSNEPDDQEGAKEPAATKKVKKEEAKYPKVEETPIKVENQTASESHYGFELPPWSIDDPFSNATQTSDEVPTTESANQEYPDFIDPVAFDQQHPDTMEYPAPDDFATMAMVAPFHATWNHSNSDQLDDGNEQEPFFSVESLQ